jgi:multiple sugar transport system ATP-binding protein
MGSVAIRDVRKAYGAVEVLHGVSIDIADGEFVVLVGPSGCGKSTLLRMLAGLEEITSGDVAIDGKVVNALPPKARDIAMVFQSYALYPHMTVGENMGFSLKLARAPMDERRARVGKAADMLGLDEYLARYPRQLSGGQRQRVAMGRAMVRAPKVFLFDEPLSNLDAKLRVAMRSEIKQNHQRLKTTTVYVTHDQIEAMTMADRIVVMHAGIVEQIGTPLELYDTPANLFVAGFIGSPSMNILAGRVVEGAFHAADGTRIPLPRRAPEGAAVSLGIRPEHFRLDPNGMPAEILVIEPTGSETQAALKLAGQDVVGVFRERIMQGPGEILKISPDLASVHMFDMDTGKRIIP